MDLDFDDQDDSDTDLEDAFNPYAAEDEIPVAFDPDEDDPPEPDLYDFWIERGEEE